MRVRANIPEIFIGAFLSIAILSFGFVWGSSSNPPALQQPYAYSMHGNQTHDPVPFSWDWLVRDGTAFFTAVLAGIAFLQACLFFWQLVLIKRGMKETTIAAKAAEVAARSAVIGQLPYFDYLIELLDRDTREPIPPNTIPKSAFVDVKFTNYGDLGGLVDEVRLAAIVAPTIPNDGETCVRGTKVPSVLASAARQDELPPRSLFVKEKARSIQDPDFVISIPSNDQAMILAGGASLWVYGIVAFHAFADWPGDVRKFCRRWDAKSNGFTHKGVPPGLND